MTVITQVDVTESVARALQFISYYHPPDFIQAMGQAYEREQAPAAKAALAQVLVNSRMAAIGKRPICQDTGIVIALVEVGMEVRLTGAGSLDDWINDGIRQAFKDPDNPLRASVLSDPDGTRSNTSDNTPGVIHTKLVPGNELHIEVAAKGGGSEHKAKFTVLNASDSVVDWVLEMVPTMGAGWCPPGVLGIGIGGTPEKAMLLAKEAMMEPLNIQELLDKSPSNRIEELRLELYRKVNALGIGAQGLGGLTTVLDVKVRDYPTHAANKPVAVIPNCTATRHIGFVLNGNGPATFAAPDLSLWPDLDIDLSEGARRVDLDDLTHEDTSSWQAGETLLLSGTIYTGRDAAHKRIIEIIESGQDLPVDLTGKFIYYVGPVDPVRDEVVGPAGPTTATRMDKFTDKVLASTGLLGMIGKGERGQVGIDAIRKHRAVSLIAVGGAAYLVAQSIKEAELIAFEDFQMEGIYRFKVSDMPVTVAVDANGASVHQSGPQQWKPQAEVEYLQVAQI